MPQTANPNQTMLAQACTRSAPSGTASVDSSPDLIEEFVRRTVGLRVRTQDVESLLRWIAERLRRLALPGIEHYSQLLAADSAAGRRERELLTVQFSTGESYFFRDCGQFDLLATIILPELIARRANEGTLRIWSAGCAAGEEAYSLAMLVDELSPRLAGWNVSILGTDINGKAIAKAKQGTYGRWSFRALDAARKQRYFVEHRGQWTIGERLRRMVNFRQGDLLHEPFPEAGSELHDIDLILCRNVFIYLEPTAVARVAAKLADTLADGGYLMTGHGELFGHPTGSLRVRVFPESVVMHKTAVAEPAAVFMPISAKATVPIPAADRRPEHLAHKVPAIEPRVVCIALPAAPATTPSVADIEALMQAAWREANCGAHAAAAEACRQATAMAAFDPRPYYLLAQLAQERGDVERTKALLKKVIYLDPSYVAAYLELGAVYEMEGDAGRARRMHRTAHAELKKLPAQATLPLFGDSAAGEMLRYVERLLGDRTEQVAGSTQAEAPLRSSG